MPSDWVSYIDRVDDFRIQDASPEEWNRWYHQFKLVLHASFDRLPDTQRVALLMMKCKGFQPAWELLGINVDDIDLDAFVLKMTRYLNPINARILLFMRKQGKDESFERFANDLETLSWPCRYRDDRILRDVFVMNMHPCHAEISEAICAMCDVSFEEALAVAKSMCQEVSKSDHDFFTLRASSSLGLDALNHVNVRMMPIKPGPHEVLLLNIDPTDKNLCQVCPKMMLGARNDFLLAFNEWMKNCKDPAVAPIPGSNYAALIKCKWFRVKVLSIDGRQKAKILAVDFGWVSNAPFSVFRNLPLDFRPPAPLLWNLSFRTPLPKDVKTDAMLMIDVAFVNKQWVASLINVSQPGLSDITPQGLPFPRTLENSEPRKAASDCEFEQYQKSQIDRTEKAQRQGRTQGKDIPHDHGRSKSKGRQNRSRSNGRGLNEVPSGSDSDSIGAIRTEFDNSQTGYRRVFIQRSNQPVVDLGTHLDNKPEGHRQNNIRFDRRNTNGHQKSGYLTDSCVVPRSGGKLKTGLHSFHPESASSPKSGGIGVDQSINGNCSGQLPDNRSILSSADSSVGFNNNINSNMNGRRLPMNQRESGNKKRSAPQSSCRDEVEPAKHIPAFVPRPVELDQASGGPRNQHPEEKKPASSIPPSRGRPWSMNDRQVPVDRYIKVRPIDRSPDGGILYCVFDSLMSEFMDMSEQLMSLEELEPIADPVEGNLCLADVEGNWYRAKITRVHPSGERVKLKFLDFGNKETKNVSELRVLPPRFWEIQPYAFPVKIHSGLQVDPVQDIEVLAVSKDDDGIWQAKLRIDGADQAVPAEPPVAAPSAAAHPVAVPPAARTVPPPAAPSIAAPAHLARTTAANIRTAPPPRPLRTCPIPRNTFTNVKILHVGPEGIFAAEESKLFDISDIQAEINGGRTLNPLRGSPLVDSLCVAPYQGELYRAKVLEVQPNKCLVVFVDFGNEALIPIQDLKHLPDELCKNIVTFQLSFDPRSDVIVQSGMNLDVTPVVLQSDGSWLVQIRGDPSPGPDYALPLDDDLD